MPGQQFPRSVTIIPARQTFDRQRARSEVFLQLRMKLPGYGWLDLVLYGHMAAPALSILRRQQTGKGIRQFIPNSPEAFRFDPESNAPAQQHNIA